MNVSELLDAAETHLVKGRHAAAETLFTEAMVRTGGAVRAIAGLGTIALRAGDVRKAEDLFGRALALAPEDAGLLVGMATVHLHAQRAEEAETCLRRAMRLEPTLPAAPANLALVLLSRHDLDGARALARRALELAPDSPDMLVSLANVETLRGAVGAARSLLEKAAALAPDRADVAVGRATLCQLAGDLPAAVQSLERARLLEPDAPSVLARLAECRVALGELEEARRLVRQAVAVAPAVCEIRNAEGVVLMHTGHHAEALASFRLAAQCNPRDPAPLVNLALLMRRNHQMDAALAAVRQAIALAEHVDAAARRLEIDLLWLAGEWREAWRRHDELRTLVQAPGSVATAPDEGVADFGSSVALIVDDLSCALMGLGLLPRLATADRRTRLLCLPAYASFFRSLPGIDIVQGCESIDLSRDIEPGELPLLLDDLAQALRATPAHLAPIALDAGAPLPGIGRGLRGRDDSPAVGLWWDDTPGGPDPQMLLNALPGTPALLREPEPETPLVLPDGRTPDVLIDSATEELLDMARTLLSLDLVVAVDGAVAHLAANLRCRTVVVCRLDIPWYWQPCGPQRMRWYPTARAVARAPGGDWSALAEACEHLLADGCPQTAGAALA